MDAKAFTFWKLFGRMALTLALMTLTAHRAGAWDADSDEYIISSAADWDTFCDALLDNDTWNRFSGKTVKLGADISVTRMAGSDSHDFCGTFDGQGHTLTVDISSDAITAEPYQYVAPFRYVSHVGDTPSGIRNLKVAGTVTTGVKYAGGLIGGCWGTVDIENCAVSVTINSSVSGDGTHGGLVGVQGDGKLTIRGCVFNGNLIGSSTVKCGGFIGWRNETATIYDSFFAPAAVTVGSEGSATFARNKVDTYNSYYNCLLNDGTNYAPYLNDGAVSPKKYNNGQLAHSITAGGNTTVENAGTPATVYSVSGITAYKTGIKYGDVLYAGSGDAVSLTLGVPSGYLSLGYTASGGTLSGTANPYTLTMPDADVTVSADASPVSAHFEATADNEYTIHTAKGWDMFCDAQQDYEFSRSYGKTVILDADIAVNRMVGSAGNAFRGIFDGRGHTLTVSYNSTEERAAPFRYIEGATIKNLHVAGTITTSSKFAGGIVGQTNHGCNIIRCWSGVAITSNVDGDGTHGGLIGICCGPGYTVTVTDCLFDGQLLGENTDHCGGFVGWCESTVTLTNCLFDPSATITVNGDGCATFSRNGGTVKNCYYTTTFGEEQGTAVGTMSPEELSTALGNAWKVSDGKVVPIMTAFAVNSVPADWRVNDWEPTNGSVADIYSGTAVTLSYLGPKIVKSVSVLTPSAGDVAMLVPLLVTKGESRGTWTFTMPEGNVEVSVEYDYTCDVNNDLSIDVADIATVIDVMAGKATEYEKKADVNKDQSVDVADIATVIDAMAGKVEDAAQTKTYTVNGVTFAMIGVEGGTFQMGSNDGYYTSEKPVHLVMVSSFCIGQTEVTQELWEAVMGSNPWLEMKGPELPVMGVSWVDCQEFIIKLNELSGQQFRLPTEAEWEYAARGGNKSQGYKYSGSNTIDDVAWYDDNSGETVHDVATKQPNELGLYDMSGNVCEWCSDWYNNYTSDAQLNPTGPTSGSSHVVRGGSWQHVADDCSIARRMSLPPNFHYGYMGLRLAL